MTPSTMDWSLDSYFPEFAGADHARFKRELAGAFRTLRLRIDALESFEPATFSAWQAIVDAYEDIDRQLSHLSSYLECLSAADAANEDYRREQAEFALMQAEQAKLEVSIVGHLGAASHEHFDAFLKRDALASARHPLRRWRERARRVMPEAEEALAAELEVDGLKAWSRLYDTISGTLEFDYRRPDGTVERQPMSRRRSLMAHPDRAVRAAVFASGNDAWHSVESTCAASLNAIAGTRLTLNHRRGHDHFLEPVLFQHVMKRESLDALFAALTDRAAVARGLLARKAACIGVPAIAWYDLEAPTPGLDVSGDAEAKLAWDDAVQRVGSAFAQGYPHLAAFLQEMLNRRWVDHTPRRGKRPGAFCTGSLLTRESRVFMSFDGTMGDVVTLAHEVGHAWHSRVMRDVRPLACAYPMTLAESASTFAEMLFIDGLLADAGMDVRLKGQIVDAQVRQAAAFLLDVPMRFEFERRFYEERSGGEVSVSRFKALMAEAQRHFFGESLAAGEEDPMFWASKLHFYIADVAFYNFPYTVGFLLSRALFACFKEQGSAFLPRYEEFLARTGSATCEELARDVLGANLAEPAFWAAAIDGLAPLASQYEALTRPAG